MLIGWVAKTSGLLVNLKLGGRLFGENYWENAFDSGCFVGYV
jgi:hypothetical protein